MNPQDASRPQYTPMHGDRLIFTRRETPSHKLPAVILGRDSTGTLRVHVRSYAVADDGRLWPLSRGGQSFTLTEWQQLVLDIETAVRSEGGR